MISFGLSKLTQATRLVRPYRDPEAARSYTMGVDLARVEDFSVLSVMDGTGKQVYHERFNQISWERQCSSIQPVAGRYHARIFVDSTGVGDPIYERLRKLGLDVKPFQFTNASKERLIDHLAMQIEQGKIRLLDVPDQGTGLRPVLTVLPFQGCVIPIVSLTNTPRRGITT